MKTKETNKTDSLESSLPSPSSALKGLFEVNGFYVYLTKQREIECVGRRTRSGVRMIIWLMPFTAQRFKSYVNDFDVDEQIDLHRQMKDYKDNFTISESLEDFTDFHNHLKEVASLL